MSELLDEFLASLEKFGELTDLGIEDRAVTNIAVCLGSARCLTAALSQLALTERHPLAVIAGYFR